MDRPFWWLRNRLQRVGQRGEEMRLCEYHIAQGRSPVQKPQLIRWRNLGRRQRPRNEC